MQAFVATIVLFLMCLDTAQAQHYSSESCPKVRLVQDFDSRQIYGTWYESLRYFISMEEGATCVIAHYSISRYGEFDIVYAFNQAYGPRKFLEGTAYSSGAHNEAEYTVVFKNGNSLAYSILDTDYSSYIIFYKCVPTGNGSNQNVWIMTKKINDYKAVASAFKTLEAYDIDIDPLINTNQHNC